MNLQNNILQWVGKRQFDKTELPSFLIQGLNPALKLRPYQEECFRYFLNYWDNDFEGKEYKPHLLFHMATGSGKTLIMAGLMLFLYEKGYRNFLFFVDSNNIIEKTKDNFTKQVSPKYLFAPNIQIGNKNIEIKLVDNFQGVSDYCINLCLTSIQGLHSTLNAPKENSLTYDDFEDKQIVLISDEAHHINTATKKGKKATDENQTIVDFGNDYLSDDWETTVMRIFNSNYKNILLEFTATCDLSDPNIAEKYNNKIIFDYPLRKFREDGYSKDIEVVQSNLEPIDRAIQTVILSQYKRKLFNEIRQDIKPVVMLKSKTIKDNEAFYNLFNQTIKELKAEDLNKIKIGAKDDIKEAFTFFEEKNITLDNLLLELKEDFKEDNLLLVDGKNISPEKQQMLNSLEAQDNEFRVVFAVDMLNEGWDVLNLYDIVRLYESRDSNQNKPGKTTMQEAQLIGRGARYMPFTIPETDKPKGKRKFDDNIKSRFRTIEKLHYHSSYNPRYISELNKAMVSTGIIAEKTKNIHLKLKDSFKKSKLYDSGYVFVNSQEAYSINENVNSFGNNILNYTFKIKIHSGEMRSSLVFEKASEVDINTKQVNYRLKEFGNNVIREAINRIDSYKFSKLKEVFPSLPSIKHFIESDNYLANLMVSVYGNDSDVNNLSQRNKLGVVIEVLKEIEPNLIKSTYALRGKKEFTPKNIKALIYDKVLKVSLDENSDQEFGRSMKEPTNSFLMMDLMQHDWYAFEDCFGTSEEKQLVKYMYSIYPKLKEKYEDIYLVRNERQVRIYDFEQGRGFEPDYLLFVRRKGENERFENIQIFIEPKGNHLKDYDKWKEDFLMQIKDESEILFSTQVSDFRIVGMPFYIYKEVQRFDNAFETEFGVSGLSHE